MELFLKRIAKKENYTIGNLYIDGIWFCNTLEDTDRGLTSSMSVSEILKTKIHGQTAIPAGKYQITLSVKSPKFSEKSFYIENANGGRLPRLLNVPGFSGILLHVGEGANGYRLTQGCILVGKNTIVGGLTNSKETFIELYKKLQTSSNITIQIE